MIQQSSKAIALCCLAAMTAFAQQPAASEDRAAQARERLAQIQSRLKLTPEQTEKLKPIVQKEVEELRAVRDKHASDTSRRGKMNMLREMKGVQEKYQDQIAAVLTPEQMNEWKKIKEERKQEMKQKWGSR
jgi:Spy/CpxP family protein refolding chaperone